MKFNILTQSVDNCRLFSFISDANGFAICIPYKPHKIFTYLRWNELISIFDSHSQPLEIRFTLQIHQNSRNFNRIYVPFTDIHQIICKVMQLMNRNFRSFCAFIFAAQMEADIEIVYIRIIIDKNGNRKAFASGYCSCKHTNFMSKVCRKSTENVESWVCVCV